MAHHEREGRPQFSQPVRQVVMMLIALGLAGAGAFMALPRVMPVFEANPYLNGFIAFVFCDRGAGDLLAGGAADQFGALDRTLCRRDHHR